MSVTDEQIAEWERLAGAAGPFERAEGAALRECPLCDGDAEVESVAFDAKDDASTVVAYGIGDGLMRAEAFVEQAPGAVLALAAALREARALLAEARANLNYHDGDHIERCNRIDAFLGSDR